MGGELFIKGSRREEMGVGMEKGRDLSAQFELRIEHQRKEFHFISKVKIM